MINVLKKSLAWALAIVTAAFTFIPEAFFGAMIWIPERVNGDNGFVQKNADILNIIISRVVVFIIVWALALAAYSVICKCRQSVTIRGNNYIIKVEYGNILKVTNCKKVINFDECFSTCVGNGPGDIKPNSICGQYLTQYPDTDMPKLLEAANLKPLKKKSAYEHKDKYQPGSIAPNGDDLLMAFAKLDENGRGIFSSRDDYLDCLSTLWKEIDKHYGQKDVCIPLLGAGITRFGNASGASYSAQELLEIIILSYKLSSYKIKAPYKLRIICKKSMGFSLNRISQ